MTTPDDILRRYLDDQQTPTPEPEQSPEDVIRSFLGQAESPAPAPLPSLPQPEGESPPPPGSPSVNFLAEQRAFEESKRIPPEMLNAPNPERPGLPEDILRQFLTITEPGNFMEAPVLPGGGSLSDISRGSEIAGESIGVPVLEGLETVGPALPGAPLQRQEFVGPTPEVDPNLPIEERLIAQQRARPLSEQILSQGVADPTLAIPGVGIPRLGARTAAQVTERGAPTIAREVAEQAATPPLPAPGSTSQPTDTVKKLTELIRSAKPVRAETETLRTAERQRRVAAGASILERGEGREAFTAARQPLAGELPRAAFEPPEVGLSIEETSGLFNTIRDAERPFFTRLNTGNALTKVMAGEIPTRSEIRLLEDMFGPELASAVLRKRTTGAKVWENTVDLLNLPRALRTSFDASAPFRQGLVLATGHPVEFSRSFVTMLKSMAKEGAAQQVDGFLRNHPNFDRFQNAGLYHAERLAQAARLSQREEAFMSRFAQKIPGIRASERGYVTFLNKLRFDVMNNVYEGWLRSGIAPTDDDMVALARFINLATGRGELPSFLQRHADILNATFFSPRLQLSRIQLPAEVFRTTPLVRKTVAKDLVSFVGTNIAILSLLKMGGLGDVETNPISPDFGKARFANTRYEFWGSFQPIARYVAQLITGKRKSSTDQQIRSQRRGQTVLRFLRSKLAPAPGFGVSALTGTNFIGQEFGGPQERFDRTIPGPAATALDELTPLFIADVLDTIEEEGLKGGFMAIPGAFGVGVQTYETAPPQGTAPSFRGDSGQSPPPFRGERRQPVPSFR